MVLAKCLSAWLLLALSLPLSGDAWAFSLSPLGTPPLHHHTGSSSTRWRHATAAPPRRVGHVSPSGFRCGATHLCSQAGSDSVADIALGVQDPAGGGGAPTDTLPAEPWRIDVVYEDADMLVLNKPSGLGFHTEEDGTLGATGEISYSGDLYPVHRLDKVTSGVLLVAKT
ncbi:hypothetical protein T484DRAFT_1759521 [Baffinella frigidus]|nr:hypothetical protein T484DRAFT_1759521 [Cryptophyta sp. CCMP2293]